MRTQDLRLTLCALSCACLFFSFPASASALLGASDGAAKRRNHVATPGLRLPLVFIENQGQFEPECAYQVRLPRLSMSVRNDGWALHGESDFSMQFDTSGTPSSVQGLEPLQATASYFLGQAGAEAAGNTATRLEAVSTFARVRVNNLKPGLNLELFSKAGQLEYDVHLDAGVPASEAVFTLRGVEHSCLTAEGELEASVEGRVMRQRKPVSFQVEPDGTRRPIGSRFVELGQDRFGFELMGRDLACPVVIDPVLVYNEFVGGSSADMAEDIAIDGQGDMYVAGWSKSTDFPGTRDAGRARLRGRDVVVFKLSADGSDLIYVSFVGGSADDVAEALVVNELGQVTVVGSTKSSDFPAGLDAFSSRRSGASDAFAFQLDSTGHNLNWASYIGGSADDSASAIELGDNGSTLIVGTTRSKDFPTTQHAFQTDHRGARDGFAVRMDNRGRLLLYSTLLGGSRDDQVHGVSVDSMGNAYLVGETDSPDFPVSKGALSSRKNAGDAFVTKLGRAGSNLVFSTFIGGAGNDVAQAIALDSKERVWIAGTTSAGGFPVTELAFQAQALGAGDGFLLRLSVSGSKIEYGTYIGGSALDEVLGLAIDVYDSPWITGFTRSDDFPLTEEAAGKTRGGGSDAFLLALDGISGKLNFSSYLGMSGNEEGRAIAVQPGTESVVLVGFADDIAAIDRGPRSGPAHGPSDALVARYEASLCSQEARLTDLAGGAGISLSLTRPRLGSPFELKVSGAPPLARGILFSSPGPPLSSDFESLAVLHLDRSRLSVLSKFVTDEEGNWSLTGRLTNRADLCGTTLVVQAITLERRFGPLSFGQASQGLSVSFGY